MCTSTKAVKYIYKHTHRGPDRACMELDVDEVQEYLDAHYVTAPEACWRLFEFPLHAKSHVVERLPAHLEHQQSCLLHEGQKEETIAKHLRRKTKLQAWLLLNIQEYKKQSKSWNYVVFLLTQKHWMHAMAWTKKVANSFGLPKIYVL